MENPGCCRGAKHWLPSNGNKQQSTFLFGEQFQQQCEYFIPCSNVSVVAACRSYVWIYGNVLQLQHCVYGH